MGSLDASVVIRWTVAARENRSELVGLVRIQAQTSHRGNGNRRRGLLEGVHLNPAAKVAEAPSTGKQACPFTRACSTRSKPIVILYARCLVAERIRVLHFSWLVASVILNRSWL